MKLEQYTMFDEMYNTMVVLIIMFGIMFAGAGLTMLLQRWFGTDPQTVMRWVAVGDIFFGGAIK